MDRLENAFASFMERSAEALLDIRASIAEIKASNARTDAVLLEMQHQAERDRQQAERDRKDFNRRMAELSDSMGTLIEDMVTPNAPRIFSELFSSDVLLTTAIRIKRRHPADRNRIMEIDLLAAGASNVLIHRGKAQARLRESARVR